MECVEDLEMWFLQENLTTLDKMEQFQNIISCEFGHDMESLLSEWNEDNKKKFNMFKAELQEKIQMLERDRQTEVKEISEQERSLKLQLQDIQTCLNDVERKKNKKLEKEAKLIAAQKQEIESDRTVLEFKRERLIAVKNSIREREKRLPQQEQDLELQREAIALRNQAVEGKTRRMERELKRMDEYEQKILNAIRSEKLAETCTEILEIEKDAAIERTKMMIKKQDLEREMDTERALSKWEQRLARKEIECQKEKLDRCENRKRIEIAEEWKRIEKTKKKIDEDKKDLEKEKKRAEKEMKRLEKMERKRRKEEQEDARFLMEMKEDVEQRWKWRIKKEDRAMSETETGIEDVSDEEKQDTGRKQKKKEIKKARKEEQGEQRWKRRIKKEDRAMSETENISDEEKQDTRRKRKKKEMKEATPEKETDQKKKRRKKKMKQSREQNRDGDHKESEMNQKETDTDNWRTRFGAFQESLWFTMIRLRTELEFQKDELKRTELFRTLRAGRKRLVSWFRDII
ncbi:trichohyalin-like [Trichomycterus rosablanca]|uniref:trichohyalin-like n=1 Tax=Trichomycterus rosablanca TaxID=2290929 RepID=UPI002F35D062